MSVTVPELGLMIVSLTRFERTSISTSSSSVTAASATRPKELHRRAELVEHEHLAETVTVTLPIGQLLQLLVDRCLVHDTSDVADGRVYSATHWSDDDFLPAGLPGTATAHPTVMGSSALRKPIAIRPALDGDARRSRRGIQPKRAAAPPD